MSKIGMIGWVCLFWKKLSGNKSFWKIRKKPTTEAHHTTVGEVQGQGPVPRANKHHKNTWMKLIIESSSLAGDVSTLPKKGHELRKP